MNSRSRVLAALRGGTPDRVPVVEWAIDAGVVRGLGCRDYFDVVERLELDGVGVFPDESLHWIDEDTFVDEWGVTKRMTGEETAAPISSPLAKPSDLLRYTPPDPMSEHHFAGLTSAVERFRGRKAIFFACRDVFSVPRYLRGMTEILEDTILEPGLVDDLVQLALDYNIAQARDALRRGADAILLADDYAYNTGPLFSPATFDRYFREGLARIVAAIHDSGGLVVKHSDGDIMSLLGMLVSTGIDALDPIDPLGGMSVAGVRALYPRLPLKGGVPLEELCNGDPSSVRAEATQCIEESGGAGYVLSSSNTVTAAVKPENFLAMLDAAREEDR